MSGFSSILKIVDNNHFIMFHDERLPNVGIKVTLGEKEEWIHFDAYIDQAGEVDLNQVALLIKQKLQLNPQTLLFYFDHSHSTFQLIKEDLESGVHFTSAICENVITIKAELKLSDQLLANPPKYDEEVRVKRSRERIIEQAFNQVYQWRLLYRDGIVNQKGQKAKINLDQSAEIIGIPRKTLQDYFLLFRTGKSMKFNFGKCSQQKIGILRSFLREREKMKLTAQKQCQERKLLEELRAELYGMTNEQQIFDILKSNHSHSSSDEDMVFEH